MLRKLLLLLIGLLMVSCMSQTSEKQDASKQSESLQIKNLIKEKRFTLLQETETIIRLKIVKTLIDGTKNEYYNKLTIVDTLSVSATSIFINTLLDDDSYDWEVQIDQTEFLPQNQFLLKSKGEQLTVLLDTEANILGFIDLLGQELVSFKSNGIPLLRDD